MSKVELLRRGIVTKPEVIELFQGYLEAAGQLTKCRAFLGTQVLRLSGGDFNSNNRLRTDTIGPSVLVRSQHSEVEGSTEYPTEPMQTLLDEIKTHFPVHPIPSGADAIIDTYMVEHLHEILGDKAWPNLTPTECRYCSDGFNFLTPTGLHYYLPAYMTAEIVDRGRRT